MAGVQIAERLGERIRREQCHAVQLFLNVLEQSVNDRLGMLNAHGAFRLVLKTFDALIQNLLDDATSSTFRVAEPTLCWSPYSGQ